MLGYYSGLTGTFAYQSGVNFTVAQRRGREWLNRVVGPSEVSYFFAECPDVVQIETATPSSLRAVALCAWRVRRAVMLFDILFEPDESIEESREVAGDLETMFGDPDVLRLATRRLYSLGIPRIFDVAKFDSILAGLPMTSDLFSSLRRDHQNIRALKHAFDGLDPDLFDDEWPISRVRETAIEEGCFLLLGRAELGTPAFEFAVLEATKGLRAVPNKSAIISQWLRDMRTSKHRPVQAREAEYDGNGRRWSHDGDGRSNFAAFQNAMTQQGAVLDKLRKGEIDVARKYVDDLVRSQRMISSPDQVSKSLCRLSQKAKQFQIFTLQYEWALRATEVYPEDAWAHGQLADSLILMNRLVEASVALDQAEIYGDLGYAATGRARILRARGHLGEALVQYTSARDNARTEEDKLHAWVGMASALREMGQVRQSLIEIRKCLSEFPRADRAWTAYALALIDSGSMKTAFAALDRVREDSADLFPALYARASIFKTIGDAAAAEREFKNLVRSYPSSPMAACGFAYALAANGKAENALQELRSAREKYTYSPEPYIAMVEVLSDLGRRADAIAEIGRGLDRFPDEPKLSVCLARLAYKSSDPAEALAAIDKLAAERPDLVFVKLDRAKLLWRAGLPQEALAVLDQILELSPEHRGARNAKASLLMEIGQLDSAIHLLDIVEAKSEDEWRSLALRAMCMVEKGSQRGIGTLEQIQAKVPFARQKRLISAMIASLKIRDQKSSEAIKAVKHVNWDVSAVVRFHALAQGGRINLAKQAYRNANLQTAELIELRDEIARRYKIINEPAKHDGRWIIQRERSAILMEAA